MPAEAVFKFASVNRARIMETLSARKPSPLRFFISPTKGAGQGDFTRPPDRILDPPTQMGGLRKEESR
ncbi:hypothetical protein BJI48_04650 [Helicobacter sp. 11S02596-1]|nr:hypothetical protein BJI48_04650 [Helicobacter sp. 11S02596-1]